MRNYVSLVRCNAYISVFSYNSLFCFGCVHLLGFISFSYACTIQKRINQERVIPVRVCGAGEILGLFFGKFVTKQYVSSGSKLASACVWW